MSEKREVLPSLEGYTFAKLTCADVSLIQAVLERCADYLDLVAGLPPCPSLALRLCTELPEGKNEQDKWLFGIFVAPHHCIGLLDAVCNYPRSGEWFLGLLLLEPAWRGHQRGEQIYRAFEQWVISSGAHAIHLSVALQILSPNRQAGKRRGNVIFSEELRQREPKRKGRTMSLQPQPLDTIPEETKRVAHAAFPKGTLYLTLRDTLSLFYKDEDFASLFSPYGQPAETPWRLALVCIFQFLEHLPDRQAADAVRSRIDWKYVLALPLDDSGFHFSVLGKFRARLLAGSAETQLLDLLLEPLKAQKLLKARGQQRTDSTHIIAAIRSLNRLECVGETLRAALNALATHAPDWLSSIAPSDWFDRYSTRIEESRLPKGEEARREYGNLIGADGSYLLTTLFAHPSLAALRTLPAVKNLQRTWLYQYYAEEGQLRWRQAKDLPPAGMRFDSPYDPEARYGNKRNMTWTGYKVHLTETCDEGEPHLITHIETTMAMITDSELVVPIHEALSTKQMLPNQHFMDAGYTDAELFATSQPDYGVDVVGPIRSNGSWQAKAEQGFDLSSFLINWDAKTVTCPQGQTSRHWTPERTAWNQEVIEVSFAKKDCLSCPRRAVCTKAKTDPRTLTIRPQLQHEALQAARKRQETAEFRQVYAKRAGVEGTISQGIRGFGLRHCRYIGLSKAHLQHIFTAIAMNVVRSTAWLEGVPQAKTRTSRFAALQSCGA